MRFITLLILRSHRNEKGMQRNRFHNRLDLFKVIMNINYHALIKLISSVFFLCIPPSITGLSGSDGVLRCLLLTVRHRLITSPEELEPVVINFFRNINKHIR